MSLMAQPLSKSRIFKDYDSSGFMVQGLAIPHIISKFETENGDLVIEWKIR